MPVTFIDEPPVVIEPTLTGVSVPGAYCAFMSTPALFHQSVLCGSSAAMPQVVACVPVTSARLGLAPVMSISQMLGLVVWSLPTTSCASERDGEMTSVQTRTAVAAAAATRARMFVLPGT